MPAALSHLPVEVEQNLIANAFHDGAWLSVARVDLLPSQFCEPKHQEMWRAIIASAPDGAEADEQSVIHELNRTNRLDMVGGVPGVNSFSSLLQCAAITQARRWQEIVEEAAKKRALITSLEQISVMASSDAFKSEDIGVRLSELAGFAEPRKKGDDGPRRFDIAKMLDFDREQDPDSVLGNRWLCRGGSCLLVAQTGAGKSALCTQMALSWALGKPAFGIETKRGPLRSLIIQSENDEGDVAESVQGAVHSMNIAKGSQQLADISDRVLFCREAVRTGEDFGKLLRSMVLAHRADVVFVDPLLGFAGVDLSDQEQASHFLRHIIQPILSETGVILFSVHHTTKPAKPSDGKGGPASLSDLSYAGAGSAELANWHRAVMVIQKDVTAEGQDEQPHYTLRLAKRGGRAGVKDANGDFTRSIPLRHCKIPGVIAWEVRSDSESFASTPLIERKGTAKASEPHKGYQGSHSDF